MKKYSTLLTLALMSLTATSALHAYVWPMTNKTNKTLLIQAELKSSKNAYFALAKPGQKIEFSWPAGNAMKGFFLNKIKYVIVDQYLLDNANFLNKDKTAVDNPRTALSWLNEHATKYPRTEMHYLAYVLPPGYDISRLPYNVPPMGIKEMNQIMIQIPPFRGDYTFDIIEYKGKISAMVYIQRLD